MGIWRDLRFALGVSRKNPGFTLIVRFLLMLGIGANATVFTLVNAVLFRPLPFLHGERTPVIPGAVGGGWLVLFIACANIANLMLARAVSRTREVSRGDHDDDGDAIWDRPSYLRFPHEYKLPTEERSRGAGSGLRARLLSTGLVVIEMALAMILLAGAGVLIRSFLNLQEMQGGVNTERLLSMQIDLPEWKYPTPKARQQLRERLVAAVAAAPAVESVALASHAPIQGSYTWNFQLEGQAAALAKAPSVSGIYITSAYFRTIGAPLMRGRGFKDTDGDDAHNVAIVNERFARKYWSGLNPIGRRLRLLRDPGDSWYTVAGVSRDLRQNDPNQQPEPGPLVYLPYGEDPEGSAIVLARTRTAPASVVAELRKRVQGVDENLPVFSVMTMEQVFDLQRWPYHVFGSMFVIFAGVALILSALGVYGVMAYTVSQRSREIGVRLALGAHSGNIVSTVLSQAVIQIGVGLILGLGGAFALTGVLESMLVRIAPTDPLTFGAVAVTLTGAAMLACWIPVRRALRLDPAVVLRYE